jgi:hypothetical protein
MTDTQPKQTETGSRVGDRAEREDLLPESLGRRATTMTAIPAVTYRIARQRKTRVNVAKFS